MKDLLSEEDLFQIYNRPRTDLTSYDISQYYTETLEHEAYLDFKKMKDTG